jgi:hypothetical protein
VCVCLFGGGGDWGVCVCLCVCVNQRIRHSVGIGGGVGIGECVHVHTYIIHHKLTRSTIPALSPFPSSWGAAATTASSTRLMASVHSFLPCFDWWLVERCVYM